MKKCIKCLKEKDISQYHFKDKASGTRCNTCKECKSSYNKQIESKPENKLKRKKQKEAYWLKIKYTAKEKRSPYMRIKRRTDIQYRKANTIRASLSYALSNRTKTLPKYLGLSTVDEAIKFIESKFKPGMSWENRREWQIDHIIPLSSFDLTDKKQVEIANNYSNIQILFAKENKEKRNNY